MRRPTTLLAGVSIWVGASTRAPLLRGGGGEGGGGGGATWSRSSAVFCRLSNGSMSLLLAEPMQKVLSVPYHDNKPGASH